MDRKDVDAAVAENSHLRGLYGVPAGLLAIAAALSNSERGPFANPWFILPVALVLALSAWGIWRYYTNAFGRATPSAKDSTRTLVTLAIGVPAVILGSMFLSSRVSWSLDLPVNTTAIAMGLVMLIAVGSTVGVRPHHLLVYGTLFVVGAIPVWERGGMSGNTGLFMTGVAIIVGGILDHRMLVQRFGSATVLDQEDDRAGTQ